MLLVKCDKEQRKNRKTKKDNVSFVISVGTTLRKKPQNQEASMVTSKRIIICGITFSTWPI